MTIIWCMVPEIRSTTDIIFCYSGLFFALLPTYGPRKSKLKKKNGKSTWRYYHFTNIKDSHMMHGSWDMECNWQNFLSFWTIFCPLTPLTTQKIKILKKMKKFPGDIIILHRCNVNDNYTMHGSWDMERVTDRIFCHFGLFFALLPL